MHAIRECFKDELVDRHRANAAHDDDDCGVCERFISRHSAVGCEIAEQKTEKDRLCETNKDIVTELNAAEKQIFTPKCLVDGFDERRILAVGLQLGIPMSKDRARMEE